MAGDRSVELVMPKSFATPKRSRRLTLGSTAVQFRQLKEGLYFGYVMADGLYVAEPEKALLDQCYLAARGLTDLAWDELDLSTLNRDRLVDWATRFPPAVQACVEKSLAANR